MSLHEIQQKMRACSGRDDLPEKARQLLARFADELAAALAGGGEAVAWLIDDGDVKFLSSRNSDAEVWGAIDGYTITPLFTHPAGAVQVTEEAMVRDASYFRWLTGDHADREEREAVRRILGSMGTRSYSGTLLDIEGALRDLGYDTAALNPGGSRE